MRSYRPIAALRTLGFAAIGYLVVLATGAGVGGSMDGDGFAGLGLIAITTVVLAPLGAVIGGYLGLKRFGHADRSRSGWGLTALVAAVTVILMVIVEPPFQIMVPLLGLTLAAIVRSGVRPATAGVTPRPTRTVRLP